LFSAESSGQPSAFRAATATKRVDHMALRARSVSADELTAFDERKLSLGLSNRMRALLSNRVQSQARCSD
jgi:hypothetical protein